LQIGTKPDEYAKEYKKEKQNGHLSCDALCEHRVPCSYEGMSTQLAERYGYDYKVNPIEQLNHVGYTIGSLIIRKIRGK